MWTKTIKKEFKGISSSDIWKAWKDVENWPNWNKAMEACELQGEFVSGSEYHMKPKGMALLKLSLLDVEEGKTYTEKIVQLGAVIAAKHEVKEIEGGIELTDTITISGKAGAMIAKMLGEKLYQKSEASMNDIVAYIENLSEKIGS